MTICSRSECQTTAGCQCHRLSLWSITRSVALSDYTDEEIAREHHYRMLKKLGDQRIGGQAVGFGLPPAVNR